ncbi:MAG: hypothetical protein QNJ32_18420 [Xenococcaceae cyanobacterium MO_167.B27]|nr:hypothetical protein [Xenococcaceae cyanobacterium MO_167.B27]
MRLTTQLSLTIRKLREEKAVEMAFTLQPKGTGGKYLALSSTK